MRAYNVIDRLITYGPPANCAECIAHCYICQFATMTHDATVANIPECQACIKCRLRHKCFVIDDYVYNKDKPKCTISDYIRAYLELV